MHILELFFQIHDPSTRNRQGNDIGTSYRSAIFYTSDDQQRVAEDTIADVDASGLWPGKVVTEVKPCRDRSGRAEARATGSLPGALSRMATPATSRGRTGSSHTGVPRCEERLKRPRLTFLAATRPARSKHGFGLSIGR